MARDFAKQFYKSKPWRDCREAYFASQYGLCEKCGGPGYIVHHKEHLNPGNINDPDVSLNWDNLELLCQTCHNTVHGGESSTVDGLAFDAEGNIVQV